MVCLSPQSFMQEEQRLGASLFPQFVRPTFPFIYSISFRFFEIYICVTLSGFKRKKREKMCVYEEIKDMYINVVLVGFRTLIFVT